MNKPVEPVHTDELWRDMKSLLHLISFFFAIVSAHALINHNHDAATYYLLSAWILKQFAKED